MSRYEMAAAPCGTVSSAHYLASQAGVWMLRQGGNAVDAAVCAAATIAVVLPSLNGVGGDVFAQVWDSGSSRPVGLNASGRSGSLATLDLLKARGHSHIPERGPLSISVPGAVSGWQALLSRFGTRRLYDILEPAIGYAESGAPVTSGMAQALVASQDFILNDSEMSAVFTRQGRLLQQGERFENPDLAQSLRSIGQTDGETFYRGSLADRMAEGLSSAGTFITRDDLRDHKAEWVDPVSTGFAQRDVFELPPNSQGIAALEMLNMVELDGTVAGLEHNSAGYVAKLCTWISLAIEDRDGYITDPAFANVPVERLVSRSYAKERMAALRPAAGSAREGDTIYLCAVDNNRLAVSMIQSQYRGFGSGVMLPGTGIHMNNRGSYFSSDPLHVNKLEPRKRTMHTLMPGMVGREGQAELAFGTMGGDAQPQIHLQVLLNHYVFGMNIQESIEAPRFVWAPSPGNAKRVQIEERFSPHVGEELNAMGWEVEMVGPWHGQMGHAQAIRLTTDGLEGAADPRGDGLAAGY